jgi:hypothetical protein
MQRVAVLIIIGVVGKRDGVKKEASRAVLMAAAAVRRGRKKGRKTPRATCDE